MGDVVHPQTILVSLLINRLQRWEYDRERMEPELVRFKLREVSTSTPPSVPASHCLHGAIELWRAWDESAGSGE